MHCWFSVIFSATPQGTVHSQEHLTAFMLWKLPWSICETDLPSTCRCSRGGGLCGAGLWSYSGRRKQHSQMLKPQCPHWGMLRSTCRRRWLSLCFVLSPFSHVQLLTVALQASLSMGFSQKEYWSGLPHPAQGYLPDPGIEPTSFMSLALASVFSATSTTTH